MSQPKEVDTGAVQFSWGEKRGRGKEKSVQFYGSFTYDGDKYSLYDCVYVYHDGEPEPYIGKIIKIWEQPMQKRKVKILWFFRPIEVRNFLAEYKEPLRNEIFLACGEGEGLSDVNALEVIAGKCNVICNSKDTRNPQPLEEDLKGADYIFYRTFDVENLTISDKIGDNVAGVEAKYIFNWKEALKDSTGDKSSDKNGESRKSSHPVGLAPEADQNVGKSLSVVKAISRPVGLAPEADQNVGKSLSVEKAIPKSEPGFDTDARKASLDLLDDRPSKKIKLSDSAKQSEHSQKNGSSLRKQEVVSDGIDKKSSAVVAKISLDRVKSKLDADSLGLNKGPAVKSKLDAVTSKSSDKSLKLASPRHMKEQQLTNETVVVPRKPEVDASKWFTGLPWEDRILKAKEQGTLVLLENFDISYTSEEIEDLIYHFFKKKCSARVIECSTFSNPNNGQALIICKNRGDADEILKELKGRVLMLSNFRPLVGRRSVPPPRQPGKSSKFFGHFFIDKLKQQMQREEWRKAVSTSHCSQPNTIEYEMGMDWMLLQEKSMSWWKELHKGQKDEIKQTMEKARK